MMDQITGKKTLESVVSFSEFWGVFITLVGAVLLFVAVAANKPLKKLLAAEAKKGREEAEHERLVLQTKIAEAQKASDEANERAALANERAEQESLARVKIEERIASRRISQKTHRDLVTALKPYANTVVVVNKLGDFEAGQFADDIIKVLADAKWDVRVQYTGMITPPVYGLQCAVDESSAGKALGALLRDLPTATVKVLPGSNSDAHASIFVGLKPPP